MSDPVVARLARPDDAEAVYRMLMEMHAEDFAGYTLDPDRVGGAIARGMNEGFLFVAERDGALLGSTCWVPSEWWFSSDVRLICLWLYVLRRHRRSQAAVRLIRAAKKAVASTGLEGMASLFTRVDAARKGMLLGRHLQPVGGVFLIDGAGPRTADRGP